MLKNRRQSCAYSHDAPKLTHPLLNQGIPAITDIQLPNLHRPSLKNADKAVRMALKYTVHMTTHFVDVRHRVIDSIWEIKPVSVPDAVKTTAALADTNRIWSLHSHLLPDWQRHAES